MWRSCLAAALALGLATPAHSQTTSPVASTDGLLCRSAVAAAERSSGIPAHLLAAIARVESGRRDPVSGAVHPWPWSVNAEGQGFLYDSKAQAVAAVRTMQARGVQSIDVGCAQINLMHHPDAFPNLEAAFDPIANARYAAQFLKELYAQTGDWNKATAMYHSATPGMAPSTSRKLRQFGPRSSDWRG
jgi:Transglycosylase SLT domain